MDPKLSQFASGAVIPGTPYEAVVLLGVGGMGSVYEVRHRVLGRKFVLKALHGQLASRRDLVARMANEWRTLGALNHKNIVSVTDAGFTSDGVPYYIMERLEGETLADLIRREGRLDPRRAALLTLDILDGLAAAHGIYAIHRDLKPQNVFISGGTAKLLDFGIAKLRDQASRVITAAGLTIGTPRYMSPEQAAGNELDARSDLYATGLVFFEMLTGKSPFSHIKDAHELVLAQMSEEPPRADWVCPDLPAEVADLVQRFLAKNPTARPHTALVAHRELSALAKSLPSAVESTQVTHSGQYEAETVGPKQDARPAASELGGIARAVSSAEDPALAPTESVLRPSHQAPDRPKEETNHVLPAVTRGARSAPRTRSHPLLLAGLGAALLAAAGVLAGSLSGVLPAIPRLFSAGDPPKDLEVLGAQGFDSGRAERATPEYDRLAPSVSADPTVSPVQGASEIAVSGMPGEAAQNAPEPASTKKPNGGRRAPAAPASSTPPPPDAPEMSGAPSALNSPPSGESKPLVPRADKAQLPRAEVDPFAPSSQKSKTKPVSPERMGAPALPGSGL